MLEGCFVEVTVAVNRSGGRSEWDGCERNMNSSVWQKDLREIDRMCILSEGSLNERLVKVIGDRSSTLF